MRSFCHAVLLLLCIPAVLVAADPATQPVVDARAILESVVRQFNSAQRMAITYRYDETSTPVEDDLDELVTAMFQQLDCTIYVNRPGEIEQRRTDASHFQPGDPLRFVFAGADVYSEYLHGADRILLAEPAVDPATVDQVLTIGAAPYAWFHDPFVWMIHSESWKHYFSYASNVRHVGWGRKLGVIGVKPAVRIAFTMFDGSSWEMWIDRAAGDRLIRLYIHETMSPTFVAFRNANDSKRGVLWGDEDVARRKTAELRLQRRFDFDTIDFDPKFPDDAFTQPKGEPRRREDPFQPLGDSVGVAVPDVIGRTRQGDEVKLEKFLGEPFVMISLGWNGLQMADRLALLHRHVATVAREGLGGHAAGVVVVVAAEPGDAVNNLLAQPEFQGMTVVVADPKGSKFSVFQGGSIAIVGRDGRVVWNGGVPYAVGFPRFAQALANAAEK